MVSHSLNVEQLSKMELNPFKQSTAIMDHYGYFEIILLLNDKKYRYGFSLSVDGDIASEWLFGPAESNETFYFKRKESEINLNPLWFQEGDDLPKEKLRSNALFLSFCASYDGNVSTTIKTSLPERSHWIPQRKTDSIPSKEFQQTLIRTISLRLAKKTWSFPGLNPLV